MTYKEFLNGTPFTIEGRVERFVFKKSTNNISQINLDGTYRPYLQCVFHDSQSFRMILDLYGISNKVDISYMYLRATHSDPIDKDEF